MLNVVYFILIEKLYILFYFFLNKANIKLKN